MRASLNQSGTRRDGSPASKGPLHAKKTNAVDACRSSIARQDLNTAENVRLRPVIAAPFVKTLENTGPRLCGASALWVNDMRVAGKSMPPLPHDSTWAITNRDERQRLTGSRYATAGYATAG